MKTFNLTFTENQLSVLNDALMAMPYRIAAPMINSINSQLQATPTTPAEVQTDTGNGEPPPN